MRCPNCQSLMVPRHSAWIFFTWNYVLVLLLFFPAGFFVSYPVWLTGFVLLTLAWGILRALLTPHKIILRKEGA